MIMRALVHVEMTKRFSAEVWVDLDETKDTHATVIIKAADIAFDKDTWALESLHVENGLSSYIKDRAESITCTQCGNGQVGHFGKCSNCGTLL